MKENFEQYFKELIGVDEAQRFFKFLREGDSRRSLRVNTLRSSKEALSSWLDGKGYEVTDSPFSKEGLDLTGRGERLSLKLPYHAGWTYPQDSSSMFAVELLDPQPHEWVLDMTAAPGGKTTHIAQRMKNTGVLFANDLDKKRLKALHSNLERLGVWNTVVTRMKAHDLALMYHEKFDRILLDPSCSGEGLLGTRDGHLKQWNPKSLRRYTKDQFSLFCSAFRLLKEGGRLVYSTCTLNVLEDDGVVQQLLKRFPEAKLVAVEEVLNEEKGIQIPMQVEREDGEVLLGTRFWPQHTQTKGFFCIALTKTASIEELKHKKKHKKAKLHERYKKVKLRVIKKKQLLGLMNGIQAQYGKGVFDGILNRTGTDESQEEDMNEELEADEERDLDEETEKKRSRNEVSFVQRNGHMFVVSRDLFHAEVPFYHGLSFPLYKIDNFELTHAGLLAVAKFADKNVLDLDDLQAQDAFARNALTLTEEQIKKEEERFHGRTCEMEHLMAPIARIGEFPIGFLKKTRGYWVIQIPHQH
jgi:NOL1/NOP2/sun family putative RNA methylase